MEWIADPTAWVGLFTLILLEIVLGIDNLIFIAILADKLPPEQRDQARITGLGLALGLRIILLVGISWMVMLTDPLFTVFENEISGRDLIFLVGGLFLIFKATVELHERLEVDPHRHTKTRIYAGFWAVIAQIVVLDAVFSLDSVITAVGMVSHLEIMIGAVVVAILLMMAASKPLSAFVNAHPTIIVLCLGFLLMIGFSLIADAVGFAIPKGYLYAAIGFSVLIEAFNQVARRKKQEAFQQVSLRERTADAVLRLLGGKVETTAASEDLVAMVSGASDMQAFEPEETRMLERVLKLHDVGVTSVMTHRQDIIWLEIGESWESIMRKVRESRHSRYPLHNGNVEHLQGIVVIKDLLLHSRTGDDIDLQAIAHTPMAIPETTTVLDTLKQFKKSTNNMAVVVDEYGVLKGIVTLKDIMESIIGTLPEPAYREDYTGTRRADGSWMLDGGLSIREAEEMLGLPDMGEDISYNTVAGFVLHHLGHIPRPGEGFRWMGHYFQVTGMDKNRIDRVLVVPEAQPASENI